MNSNKTEGIEQRAKGGIWVKASERQPTTNADVPLKVDGLYYLGWYNSERELWITDSDLTFQSTEVLWLDETQSIAGSESQAQDWISVDGDSRPEHKELVLAFGIYKPSGKGLCVYRARFYKGDEYNKESFITSPGGFEIKTTHWMPLPPPPTSPNKQ